VTGLGPVEGPAPPAQEDEGCITLRLLVLRVEGGQQQQGQGGERHYAKYYRTVLPVAGKRRLRLEVWDRPYAGPPAQEQQQQQQQQQQEEGEEEERRMKMDGVVLVYSQGDR
jgi:hypothetical protein